MSNVLTTFPYTNTIVSKQVPLFPGAYTFRGVPGSNGFVPIYTSIPFFIDNGMTDILQDRDAQVIVLPGFALQLYNDISFGTLTATIDNRDGTELLYRSSANTSSSCKLFYKFPTGYAEIPTNLFKSVTFTAASATTSTVPYNSITYRLYSFTSTASTHTVSLTDTAGIGVDCLCLLIGGGGGGGYSSSGGEVAGGGGGGAGMMLYGTLKVVPGATYSITVGAGGAGQQNTTGIGSPSSITRSVSSVVVDSITAGGGGSGGGPGSLQGSYPSGIGGSSGGTWPAYGVSQAALVVSTNKYTVTGTSSLFTVSAALSYNGGVASANTAGSGGGGAGGGGGDYDFSNNGRAGGSGAAWPVNGTTYAAGGGGNNGANSGNVGIGGLGGSSGLGGSGGSGTAGTANTGSGGGAKWNSPAGAGGSGICIIAVPLYRLSA